MQHRLEINGLIFNVRDEGAGEPVLLIHGFPDDHTVWRVLAAVLVLLKRGALTSLELT